MKDVVVSGSWGRRPLVIPQRARARTPRAARNTVEAARGNPVNIASRQAGSRNHRDHSAPSRASGGVGTIARLAAEAGGRTAAGGPAPGAGQPVRPAAAAAAAAGRGQLAELRANEPRFTPDEAAALLAEAAGAELPGAAVGGADSPHRGVGVCRATTRTLALRGAPCR